MPKRLKVGSKNPFKTAGERLGGFLVSGAYLGSGKGKSKGAKRIKAKK